MKTTFAVLSLGFLVGLAVLPSGCAPAVPHAIEERKDCISCHAQNGVKPYPEWHATKQYGNDQCANCHKSKTKSDKP